MNSKFMVYFEDPFWVGYAETTDGSERRVARIVFGAEPHDAEVFMLVTRGYGQLQYRLVAADGEAPASEPVNPKRRRREAARAVRPGQGLTHARETLSRLREEQAQEKRQRRSVNRREAAAQAYLLRREKNKKRKRGH